MNFAKSQPKAIVYTKTILFILIFISGAVLLILANKSIMPTDDANTTADESDSITEKIEKIKQPPVCNVGTPLLDYLEYIGLTNTTQKTIAEYLAEKTLNPPIIPDNVLNVNGTCYYFVESGEFELLNPNTYTIKYNESYINDFIRADSYTYKKYSLGSNELFILGSEGIVNDFDGQFTALKKQTWNTFLNNYFGDNNGTFYINAYPTDSELPSELLANIGVLDSSRMYKTTASTRVVANCSDCDIHVWFNGELLYNRSKLYDRTIQERIQELLIGEKTNFIAHNQIAKSGENTLHVPKDMEKISSITALSYYVYPEINELIINSPHIDQITSDIQRFITGHLKSEYSSSVE